MFPKKRLFKDDSKLVPTYVPSGLPFRDKQRKHLAYYLSSVINGVEPPVVILHGPPGSGKTASLLHVLTYEFPKVMKLSRKEEGILFELNKRKNSVRFVYVDGSQHTRALALLGYTINKTIDPSYRWEGHAKSDVYKKFQEIPKLLVVIIDEVDKLTPPEDRDYVLRTLSREKGVSTCLISCSTDVLNNIEASTLSGIQYQYVRFPPYNVEQLTKIAKNRIVEAFWPRVVEEGAIRGAAAYAYERGGDARRVVGLLRFAGMNAEMNSSPKVTPKHMSQGIQEYEMNLVSEVIKDKSPSQKLALYAAVKLYEFEKKNRIPRVTTVMLYGLYRAYAGWLSFPLLSKDSILDFATLFEQENLLSSIRRGRQAKGVDKILRFDDAKADMVKKKLEEDLGIQNLNKEPRLLDEMSLKAVSPLVRI